MAYAWCRLGQDGTLVYFQNICMGIGGDAKHSAQVPHEP